ncbi:MAG: 4'-phosphopantetheinyl transferase superfamily protein [Lachnospiraceae bacterium]|nr:4'-phosphopantetheinyl transferase superfamily protein [Lachnospiraceae bacterium]
MIVIWKVSEYDGKTEKAEYERCLSKRAHAYLKQMLKKVYGIEKTDMWYGENGKPSLRGIKGVEFNLTHCDGLIGLVMGEKPAGIDAEKVRPLCMAAVRKTCAETEVERILASGKKDEMFFRYFTLKEAYGKAVGVGLSYPLKEVTFELASGKITCNRDGYCFKQYVIDNEYIVSVCYQVENNQRQKGKKTAKA